MRFVPAVGSYKRDKESKSNRLKHDFTGYFPEFIKIIQGNKKATDLAQLLYQLTGNGY